MILESKATTAEARAGQQTSAEQPLPTEQAKLKLEVIRKRVEWGKARRAGGGLSALMPMVQWLLARLSALRPMRVLQHYNLERGPLMSAGIGFTMFFSITGLLTTGFSVAGLVLSGQPALLDRLVASVARSAPGLLQVEGSEGLVDPQELLNPSGLGLTAAVAAVVTIVTSLGWIGGIRQGLRAMMMLAPLKRNPVLGKLIDAGTLILLGIALVISSGVSLVFGTAVNLVMDWLRLDPAVAGPVAGLIKIAVPLVLNWVTAVILFRLAGGLRLSRQALLEGTIIAGIGTTVLQVFSTELLAGAARNPLLAPFAIIIGLLIWFNLVSQVYLVSAAWSAVREGDLTTEPSAKTTGWGARQVQPGRTPVEPVRSPGATFRRRGTGRPTPK